MDMLYKYKEAFSLRDEIGTCPNIKVGIDVTDKSTYFIRLYHARKEDKKVIKKEMKHLCYLGLLFKTGKVINQKLTLDKRVVMDFRH